MGVTGVVMRLLEFLADHVFRFRYRDPVGKNDAGLITLDMGIAEEEQTRMLVHFFVMGVVVGIVVTAIVGGAAWLIAR